MKNIFLLVFAFSAWHIQAQFKELSFPMSKGAQNGFKIKMDYVDQTMAFDIMEKTIAEKDPKVDASIISFNELFFHNAILTSISAKPIDVYARFISTDTSLIVFVDLGIGFVSTATYPTEANGVQQLGLAIQQKTKAVLHQAAIDSLKAIIQKTEAQLERVNDDLKATEDAIRNNIKGAGKDDKQVAKTETKLQDNKAEIMETDTLIMRKQKDFDAFPLNNIKSENDIKNDALKANRNAHKNLVKANVKSENKILNYKVEIDLNNAKKTLAADDKKELRRIEKNIDKLNQKIAKENNAIAENKSRMKVYTAAIVADSTVVSANNAKLYAFDEAGRLKELKQLRAKSEKLKAKTEKQQTSIVENKQEAEQKRKEAEAAAKNVERLKMQQAVLKAELDALRAQLAAMGQ